MFLVCLLGSSTGLDNGHQAVHLSNVSHGGSTKISSGKERSRGISKPEISNF